MTMDNIKPVVGWTSAFLSPYKTVEFTNERRKMLIDRIKKRQYNFTHTDHQFLSYTAPFYEDGVICVLNKQEFDSVMDEVYAEYPRGARLMPEDVIELEPVDEVLFEKEKWIPKK